MTRIAVTCLLCGMLLGKSAIAQSTESEPSANQLDVKGQVGPEERPDGFVVYGYDGRSRCVKQGTFGRVLEALAAAEKGDTPATPCWITSGNLEQASSLFKLNPNRGSIPTKNCYVYSKSLRCGNWTLRLKTLTLQEAEAYAAKLKKSTPTAIIYELE